MDQFAAIPNTVPHLLSYSRIVHRRASIIIAGSVNSPKSCRPALYVENDDCYRNNINTFRLGRRKQHGTPYVTKYWWGPVCSLRSAGLINHRNSCFRNAVLQCLLHRPEFGHYLAVNHTSCDFPAELCVPCALRGLLEAQWPGVSVERTNDFRQPRTPADPSVENLRMQTTVLHQAMLDTTLPDNDMYQDLINGSQSDPFDILVYFFKQLERVESPTSHLKIAYIFDLRHEVEWECGACRRVHCRAEEAGESGAVIGICVNIQAPQRHLPMMTYLRSNGYREELEIKCPSRECERTFGGAALPRMRKRYITQAPEILVLRLNRSTTVQNSRTGRTDVVKLKDTVTFDEIIDLGEFTRSGEPLIYALQGVVAHHGETINQGHYVAAVRSLNGRSCYTVNDESVSEGPGRSDGSDLQNPRSNGQAFEPYLLFYSKIDAD